jgi:putative nucleotide binding protein
VNDLYRDQKKYEEYAYVLDYLERGRPGAPRTPHTSAGIIQMVGESYFTLLEASPKINAEYNPRDRIFVGKGDRALVSHIIGRVAYSELTSSAKAELPGVVEIIVRSSEPFFVNFFNTSQSVTPRMHSLELIPGIGKRLMFQILDIRERAAFQNFEDVEKRVGLKDPAALVSKRVLEELSQEEKYLLFTRPSAEHTYPV